VACIARHVAGGKGQVFIQSDVLDVAEDMRQCFDGNNSLRPACAPGEWLSENPLPVPTEREKLVLSQGGPVYRALYSKS
jgi:tRNA (guanine-N7-)-methyltransferase